MIDSVIARIEAADFSVLGQLGGLSPADGATIAERLSHPDPAVRELVLWVLDVLGGMAAARAGAAAALDANAQVVGLALRVLRHHAVPAVLEQVMGDYTAAPDPGVRTHLALVLGRLGTSPIQVLALAATEPDGDARDTLTLVAGHLGGAEARARAAELLASYRGRRAQRAVEDLEFLGGSWALPSLLPWLDDVAPVLRIGAEHLPGPMHLRVCDLTVNLAARLGPAPFPFPTDGKTNYTDAQLQLAKEYLHGLASA